MDKLLTRNDQDMMRYIFNQQLYQAKKLFKFPINSTKFVGKIERHYIHTKKHNVIFLEVVSTYENNMFHTLNEPFDADDTFVTRTIYDLKTGEIISIDVYENIKVTGFHSERSTSYLYCMPIYAHKRKFEYFMSNIDIPFGFAGEMFKLWRTKDFEENDEYYKDTSSDEDM